MKKRNSKPFQRKIANKNHTTKGGFTAKQNVSSKRKPPKWLAGLLIGVTIFSAGSVISIKLFELNFNFNSTTNIHNNVVDSFSTTESIDEAGNRHYTVHPSRYGSLRSVEIEVVDGQFTIVNFIGD